MPDLVRRWWPLAIVALAALWLRTHDLARRPMHADEANQAVKTGDLLESGHYAYDPHDHHGPTLYYAVLPIAWLRGESTLAGLGETTIRLVPAIFGTISVVLLGFLVAPATRARQASRPAWTAIAAAAFLAVSPPSVYYSRYFVQETLLVTFTLATFLAAAQWWRSARIGWAITGGICAGLMQATKSSAPLFLILAVVAVLAARVYRPAAWALWRHAGVASVTAVLTLSVFYSSFGTNLSGLADAFASYANAVERLGGETGHEKPWWYYLWMFGWFRTGGLVWHQLAFSALALAGFVVVFVGRARPARPGSESPWDDAALRAIAVYTALVAAAFSMIAYKTPWHVVHLVPGLAVLAAAALAGISRLRTGILVAIPFAAITLATLFQQTRRAAFMR
ncbi:MAG: phospholipid carrier-dependent glycosyltransferase, partial [Opitutus sp.]